ncbi:hypothetical protein NQ317_010808 [Molorchus minor]|uniref:Uncharacterized protein n=1 Tax=Molorchus minor TaxID=1323400 RepID=A0ABQ9IQI0_9CUCU|nr:hypothetical protein NQ317_010808 [Molorchus minor]
MEVDSGTPNLNEIEADGRRSYQSCSPNIKEIFSPGIREIESLVKQGILEKVNASEWATPSHPNASKLMGKYGYVETSKVTLNPHILDDEHPLPTVDRTFCTDSERKAYLHLEVRPEMRGTYTKYT